MNLVRIHEGRGHSQQNYFCDTVQCFYEEKWTACNYWYFTSHFLHLYFQVEKKRLTYIRRLNNSSHTDQLSAAMRGSRNFCRGGGGSTSIWQKRSNSVVCLYIAFFLVLRLVNRSQMVNFKEIYHFSRFQRGPHFSRGSNFFQGGGGGRIAYSL